MLAAQSAYVWLLLQDTCWGRREALKLLQQLKALDKLLQQICLACWAIYATQAMLMNAS